jgi:hypothetical protein
VSPWSGIVGGCSTPLPRSAPQCRPRHRLRARPRTTRSESTHAAPARAPRRQASPGQARAGRRTQAHQGRRRAGRRVRPGGNRNVPHPPRPFARPRPVRLCRARSRHGAVGGGVGPGPHRRSGAGGHGGSGHGRVAIVRRVPGPLRRRATIPPRAPRSGRCPCLRTITQAMAQRRWRGRIASPPRSDRTISWARRSRAKAHVWPRLMAARAPSCIWGDRRRRGLFLAEWSVCPPASPPGRARSPRVRSFASPPGPFQGGVEEFGAGCGRSCQPQVTARAVGPAPRGGRFGK